MEVSQGPLILDTVVRIDAYVMKRDIAPTYPYSKPTFVKYVYSGGGHRGAAKMREIRGNMTRKHRRVGQGKGK